MRYETKPKMIKKRLDLAKPNFTIQNILWDCYVNWSLTVKKSHLAQTIIVNFLMTNGPPVKLFSKYPRNVQPSLTDTELKLFLKLKFQNCHQTNLFFSPSDTERDDPPHAIIKCLLFWRKWNQLSIFFLLTRIFINYSTITSINRVTSEIRKMNYISCIVLFRMCH